MEEKRNRIANLQNNAEIGGKIITDAQELIDRIGRGHKLPWDNILAIKNSFLDAPYQLAEARESIEGAPVPLTQKDVKTALLVALAAHLRNITDQTDAAHMGTDFKIELDRLFPDPK